MGCHGLCERGPIVVVDPGNILYQRVEESDVEEIFRETVLGGKVVERLLYDDPATKARIQSAEDIPFYKAQHRIVLGAERAHRPDRHRGLHRLRRLRRPGEGL